MFLNVDLKSMVGSEMSEAIEADRPDFVSPQLLDATLPIIRDAAY